MNTPRRFSPSNPFAARAAAARERYERLVAPTARDAVMADAFPLGPGYGRKRGGERLDRTIDRAIAAEKARLEAEALASQAAAFERGEVTAQGRHVTAASRQRAALRKVAHQNRQERIARAIEARGDRPAWEVPAATWADALGYLRGSARQLVQHTHRAEVEAAMEAGRTVPPEVLADYPDLLARRN